MTKGRKKWLSVLMAVIFILGANTAAYAAPAFSAQNGVSTLRWDNTNVVLVILDIKNGMAIGTADIIAYDGVEDITVDAILEQKNSDGSYTVINSWDDCDDLDPLGQCFVWEGFYYVSRGYTYRFTIFADVTKDGVTDEITASKSYAYN